MGDETNSVGRAVKKYRQLSANNPEAKLALDVAPFSGVATSLADAGADAYEGNYADAGLDLLGVVPGAKLIKGAGAVKNMLKYAGTKADLARTTDRASDSVTYAEEKAAEAKERPKGDAGRGKVNPKQVSEMKRGGAVKSTASSRADGIAARGKTRGRIV
jgi:hypothetical protein